MQSGIMAVKKRAKAKAKSAKSSARIVQNLAGGIVQKVIWQDFGVGFCKNLCTKDSAKSDNVGMSV